MPFVWKGKVATLDGNLWDYNLVKLRIVDVSDDYRLMASPMPSEFYPVLEEVWLPAHRIAQSLSNAELVQGYLYDWHEQGLEAGEEWYVGVVSAALAQALIQG